MAPRPLKVGLISLGCPKNLVDAEIMLGSLLRNGLEITNNPADADAVIVNTCSFIDAAQEESVDSILESARLRDVRRRGQALIVAGCLSQRFREELPSLLPEVDAFMGIDQVATVTEIVKQAVARRTERLQNARREGPRAQGQKPKAAAVKQRLAAIDQRLPAPPSREAGDHASGRADHARILPPLLEVTSRPHYIPDYATPRFRLTPRHFAYLKIAEGCNHPCSFCIIPRLRGRHRSRPQRDLVEEARRLLAEGVRELNLISQDSTYYGLDLRPNASAGIATPERFNAATRALPAEAATICSLLRALNELPGEFWIRLLYTHPAHWTDELIGTIAACSKVARYVDLPLQHIHAVMLARMRRETSPAHLIGLLRRIRAGIPGIALRTTFIVGFPGETEGQFETLIEFIRATRFERLGVFTYSPEEGTVAGKLAGQVPEPVRRQRRDRAMAVQQQVAREVSASMVGRRLRVLVEGVAKRGRSPAAETASPEHGRSRSGAGLALPAEPGTHVIARGEADAPDIDGRVYVRGQLPIGEFATVRVVGHTDYDLVAVPVSP